jgi:hypothetical protein
MSKRGPAGGTNSGSPNATPSAAVALFRQAVALRGARLAPAADEVRAPWLGRQLAIAMRDWQQRARTAMSASTRLPLGQRIGVTR